MSKEYQVLRIDELVKPSDTGGLERFYRHKIKTAGGVVLTVDVASKDFTPEKAAPILAKKALEADAVLKL